jgi:hypothetical protein
MQGADRPSGILSGLSDERFRRHADTSSPTRPTEVGKVRLPTRDRSTSTPTSV